jgi:hypothetical protein
VSTLLRQASREKEGEVTTSEKLTYQQQLQHPNWQKKRLETLEDANWTCEICGDKESTLNVHHKRYISKRMAWEYERDLLAVLCNTCHSAQHEELKLLQKIVADIEPLALEQIIGLIAGYLDGLCSISPGLAWEAREGRTVSYDLGMAAAALSHGPEDYSARRINEVIKATAAAMPVTPALSNWAEDH